MEPTSRIRLAFLGADGSFLEMFEATRANPRFELAGICEVDPAMLAALDSTTGARSVADWEALLDSTIFDAVFVAHCDDEDRRAEQLRKLIQAGIPLLLSHPVLDSMLLYYELEMIRSEVGGIVLCYLPDRFHSAVVRVAQIVAMADTSAIGKVDQVVMERSIPVPSKTTVVRQFSRDVDTLRIIAGDMTRLGALAGTTGDQAYTNLGVQMSGASGIATRWSVVPGSAGSGRLSVHGANGRAVVHLTPDEHSWTFELQTPDGQTAETFEDWNPADTMLACLAAAIDDESVEPTLLDGARSLELAETIDRSLHKGRTIDLYYEEYSEEGTFKGTMASVGCGLLLVALFVLGAVAIVEQMGVQQVRVWPYVLLGTLGLFLSMQLLMLVFGRRREAAPSATGDSDGPASGS
jgi:predicted dehydrogenase